jgi:hypothetical protein
MGLESHDRARHIHSPFRPVVSFESISFYPRGPQRITLLVQRRRRLFITWYLFEPSASKDALAGVRKSL